MSEDERIPKYGLEDLPGVGDATIKKLRAAGILSLKALAICPITKLVDDVGLSEKTAEKLIKEALDVESLSLGTKNARELFESRKRLSRITTGSSEFDKLLGITYNNKDFHGGFEAGSLTELFGEFRTGKTQICHQLCVNVQLPYEQGGLEGKAYYIDTDNSFRPERIIQMAHYLDLDINRVLDNIFVSRAYNSDFQILLVKEAPKIISERGIKVLVLDNIISHFKAEYPGRGNFDLIRSLLRSHLTDLLSLTNIFQDLVIVYTNQVRIKPDVFYGNPIIHLGGNVVAHLSTTRVFLRKGKGEQRIAKVVKSPYIPDGDAVFSITEGGIRD
ncbi:MAG: DNA repair and recombination protein RadA [Candidatus Hermodarchaeota archaeon]